MNALVMTCADERLEAAKRVDKKHYQRRACLGGLLEFLQSSRIICARKGPFYSLTLKCSIIINRFMMRRSSKAEG